VKNSFFSRSAYASTKNISFPGGKILIYSSAFIALVGVIAAGYQNPQSSLQQVQSSNAPAFTTASYNRDDKAPSVDEIIAANIAASITERTSLPIAPNVASSAISLAAKSELTQSDDKAVSKPQIVQSGNNRRDMQIYVAKSGDSVGAVAERYNISENTLRWANNLDSDAIEKGRKLKIMPVNGVTHSFEKNDSVKSLAKKYNTSEARIVSFNDLELSKPKKGQNLIIPNGVLPESERPGYVEPIAAAAPTPVNNFGFGNNAGGYKVMNKNLGVSSGNKYAFGNCTSYAFERRAELGRPIGSFWGDGGSWAYSAQAAGFKVDGKPKPGSIMVTYGSPGHVAIVESVAKNGDITLSEMNYAGNFNRVTGRTVSAGQAGGYAYIH